MDDLPARRRDATVGCGVRAASVVSVSRHVAEPMVVFSDGLAGLLVGGFGDGRGDGDGIRDDGVDVHGFGRQVDARGAVGEPLGVGLVGAVKGGLADGADLVDARVEDVGWCE